MIGMVLTGIFAKDVGLTSGKVETFLYHLLALVIVAVFAFVGFVGPLQDHRPDHPAARLDRAGNARAST